MLGEILELLKKYKKILLDKKINIITFVGISIVLSAYLNIFFIDKRYETKTLIYIGPYQGEILEDSEKYTKFLMRYGNDIHDFNFVREALKETNILLDPKEVLRGLNLKINESAEMLEITYTDRDKESAVEINKALSNRFLAKYERLVERGNIKVIEHAKLLGASLKDNIFFVMLLDLIISTILICGFYIVLEEFKNNCNIDKFKEIL